MKKYCLALDLKNEKNLISQYKEYHKNIWPEIRSSIFVSGIISMEIYNTGNRLFMIMETTDEFSFNNKTILDKVNEKVQEWEILMWKFQQALPWAMPGEKWVLMENIFEL